MKPQPGLLYSRGLDYARMIKFTHTVFALPFALSAVVLAYRQNIFSIAALFWIVIAMVGARSASMGFNRIVDADFDRDNPRTACREIPRGKLSKNAAWRFVVFFSLLFILASAMLGSLCFYLSFPVLALLFSYSYTKRFTLFCHFYLGFVISLAPLGAWIGMTGRFSWAVLLLCLALLTYIAGFDILYACQDIQFDRRAGLQSIPARLGVRKALAISAGLHIFSFLFLLGMKPLFDLGAVYLLAVVVIGILFAAEHRLVHPENLSRVHVAFFHMNSAISLILLAGILLDTLFRG
ncbi:MAG: UbiA-like polyprenyltransferase [Thermodesulfobacteriota bacterium]